MFGLDLDAGKYALFVWGAYGTTACGFLWMIADSCLRTRYWRRKAEAAEAKRDAGRSA